jgi:hypothetical protein
VHTTALIRASTSRMGKRMPRHDTGRRYVYVHFDAGSRLPLSLASRKHVFFGGFDLALEGEADPFAPKEKAPPSPVKPSAHDGAIAA